jgi:hypothetical protein
VKRFKEDKQITKEALKEAIIDIIVGAFLALLLFIIISYVTSCVRQTVTIKVGQDAKIDTTIYKESNLLKINKE